MYVYVAIFVLLQDRYLIIPMIVAVFGRSVGSVLCLTNEISVLFGQSRCLLYTSDAADE